MIEWTSLLGFGEAGQAFAQPGVAAFDIATENGETRPLKIAEFESAEIRWSATPAGALAQADLVLCLVTADQALAAAQRCAPLLKLGTLWLDMNSVAPATKREAAQAIEAAGGRYVDVAVMAPVLPARLAVPLLVAGPHAADATEALRAYGFTKVAVSGPNVGDASAIKMIRSVMVKGLEALTAECVLAAERAGVREAVLASLDASWREQGWAERVDYNLDRMLAHGTRRAAEMEEVARTLTDLGVDPAMTRGTIQRQREMGGLGLTPPYGLTAKLAAIETREEDQAA
jgi:3-hydroxyisobutyrate dehydrogenase-like beta-hydroxyacid dehydrogenase